MSDGQRPPGRAGRTPGLSIAAICSRSSGSRFGLEDLSLQVKRGGFLACVGPDGSGKSTMLRILCGAMSPDSGQATVLGFDVLKEARRRSRNVSVTACRNASSSVFRISPYGKICASTPTSTWCAGLPDDRPAPPGGVFAYAAFGDRLAGKLSGGIEQKLALACTLVHRPDTCCF